MKEVWIIEKGEYSDYRVVGIFSTEENANKIAQLLNDPEDGCEQCTVAKRVLDPLVHELNEGHQSFTIVMLKDGTVEKCALNTERPSAYDLGEKGHVWRRSKALMYKGTNVQDCLRGSFWGTDSTHAIKIANEQRAQLIASGEWDRVDA